MGKGRSKKTQTFGEAEFTKFLFGSVFRFSVSWYRQPDVKILKQNINKSKTQPINCDRSSLKFTCLWPKSASPQMFVCSRPADQGRNHRGESAKTAAQFGPRNFFRQSLFRRTVIFISSKNLLSSLFFCCGEAAPNPSNWAASLELRADSWDFRPTQLN